jgi:HEAT repeat protein
MKAMLISTLILGCAALAPAAPPPLDDTPAVVNGRVETRAASGLEAALRQAAAHASEPSWIGYAVPMVPGMGSVCCWSGHDGKRKDSICRLEGENNGWSSDRAAPRSEQPLHVLLRFEHGRVDTVRGFSADCRLDAGGRRLVWLGSVQPAESVSYLTNLARTGGEGRRGWLDEAISALALHRHDKADEALEGLAAAGSPAKLREQALFWMGQTRGERGARYLAGVIRDDRDDKVREHAIFSLSQSSVSSAAATITRTAQDDRSPHIRGQALFWLAQMQAPDAAGAEGAIAAATEKDPDAGVRKQAVFALSQLHGGRAVPALLKVARGSRDAALRKEAFFWLAQSKDPAALAYLDKVLND